MITEILRLAVCAVKTEAVLQPFEPCKEYFILKYGKEYTPLLFFYINKNRKKLKKWIASSVNFFFSLLFPLFLFWVSTFASSNVFPPNPIKRFKSQQTCHLFTISYACELQNFSITPLLFSCKYRLTFIAIQYLHISVHSELLIEFVHTLSWFFCSHTHFFFPFQFIYIIPARILSF